MEYGHSSSAFYDPTKESKNEDMIIIVPMSSNDNNSACLGLDDSDDFRTKMSQAGSNYNRVVTSISGCEPNSFSRTEYVLKNKPIYRLAR